MGEVSGPRAIRRRGEYGFHSVPWETEGGRGDLKRINLKKKLRRSVSWESAALKVGESEGQELRRRFLISLLLLGGGGSREAHFHKGGRYQVN